MRRNLVIRLCQAKERNRRTRGIGTAKFFMEDLASRISSRVQLTTDGH
jgi:hypothetical protein